MIQLVVVRLVVLAASFALLVGVWLWCKETEAAGMTRRHRKPRSATGTRPSVISRGGGWHRLPTTTEATRRIVPVWPSRDPDDKDPGRRYLPGAATEPTTHGRHALAA